MIRALENAELAGDLDCALQRILNVHELVPVPMNLAPIDDPHLFDRRIPLDGSVTDASIAADAGIVQSKLDLDGLIPAAWLGTTATTAARGDLAEYKANKNQPGGYAGLNASGKVAAAQLPDDIGTGTVTSVALSMPSGEFNVVGSPITTAGSINVSWKPQADASWFGNASGASAAPVFNATPIPVALIPDLDASHITSGVIDAARLPVAGVGPGVVPDPGTGDPTDYLARDMTYQPVPVLGSVAYQPTVGSPVITLSPLPDPLGNNVYQITVTTPGSGLFYATGTTTPGAYSEIAPGSLVTVAPGTNIWAYASRPGYNNSAIVHT